MTIEKNNCSVSIEVIATGVEIPICHMFCLFLNDEDLWVTEILILHEDLIQIKDTRTFRL